jgi:hypothetical protein
MIHERIAATGCLPGFYIKYVYENTMPNAKLRVFYQDLCKKTMFSECFQQLEHDWQTVTFVHDVLPAIRRSAATGISGFVLIDVNGMIILDLEES